MDDHTVPTIPDGTTSDPPDIFLNRLRAVCRQTNLRWFTSGYDDEDITITPNNERQFPYLYFRTNPNGLWLFVDKYNENEVCAPTTEHRLFTYMRYAMPLGFWIDNTTERGVDALRDARLACAGIPYYTNKDPKSREQTTVAIQLLEGDPDPEDVLDRPPFLTVDMNSGVMRIHTTGYSNVATLDDLRALVATLHSDQLSPQPAGPALLARLDAICAQL